MNESIVYGTFSKFSVGCSIMILSFYSFKESSVSYDRLLLINVFEDFFVQTTSLKHSLQKLFLFKLDFRRGLWRIHYIILLCTFFNRWTVEGPIASITRNRNSVDRGNILYTLWLPFILFLDRSIDILFCFFQSP